MEKQQYLAVFDAADIYTMHSEVGKVGDPWPVQRPLQVVQRYHGDGISVDVELLFPDGLVPVDVMTPGHKYRITIERIEDE